MSLDKLMEAYPGLRNVVGSGSNAAAAIALHNIENVKQVHSLLEAAKVGWERPYCSMILPISAVKDCWKRRI